MFSRPVVDMAVAQKNQAQKGLFWEIRLEPVPWLSNKNGTYEKCGYTDGAKAVLGEQWVSPNIFCRVLNGLF